MNSQFELKKRGAIFVGAPIQYALSRRTFDKGLRRRLENVFRACQPCGYEIFSAHRVEEFGDIDMEGQHHQIACRDFEWMVKCDCFVAVMPRGAGGKSLRSDGTCIELGWASAMHKPIIIIRDLQQPHSQLVKGLGALTRIYEIDLNDFDRTPERLTHVLGQVLVNRRVRFLQRPTP